MTLTGREIQALLGAIMIHFHVPFARLKKAVLPPEDIAVVDGIGDRLRIAREALKPDAPRETPAWLEALLCAGAEIPLTDVEASALVKITRPCLAELRTDGSLSAFVGPGVGLDALRSAHEKIAAQVGLAVPNSFRPNPSEP